MINIAITGAGYIAEIHARAVKNTPGTQLTAVVDRFSGTAERFAAKYGIPRWYETLDDLLRAGGVDAMLVSTPNYLHAPQTVASLNAGVHVMVEKPMAMDALQAEEMLTASQKSGAALMVAHCWRFDPEVNWLRQQAQCGKLGRIIRTKGYGVHVYWGPGGWFTEKEFAGGGAMADMGVHALDTARFLLGDPLPISVYARIGTYYHDHNVDDTGLILVNWDDGSSSYLESGWWQPHSDGAIAATQLYGTLGFGQLFPTYLSLTSGTQMADFPSPRQPHTPQSLYDSQLGYFVSCIHQKQTPNPGGLEGWMNMRVVDAAYQSARTDKVVRL